MKKIYGALICAAIVAGVFYACKKENESVNPAPMKTKPVLANNSSARPTGSVRVLFSKNYGDTVYKMVLTGTPDGQITVDRGIYPTTRPDTINRVLYFDDGIVESGLVPQSDGTRKGDTLRATLPLGKRYFYILFSPHVTPYQVADGGGGCFDAFCFSGCDSEETDWMYRCEVIGAGELKDCMSVLCDECYFFAKWGSPCPSPNRIYRFGGAVVIEAQSLNVVNH